MGTGALLEVNAALRRRAIHAIALGTRLIQIH
jgi:hypothetical protein